MNLRTASLLVAVVLIAVSVHGGQPLFEDPLSSLANWAAMSPEAVSLEGGAIKIVAKNSSPALTRDLDAKLLAGRKILFSVEAKGQGIQIGEAMFDTGKIQVVYKSGPSKQTAYGAERFSGDFDWKRVELLVDFPKDLASAQVRLGFQQTTGVLWFRNFSVAPLEKDDSFPYPLTEALKSEPYRIAVRTSEAKPLNRLIHGFNTNMSTGNISYGSPEIHKEVSLLRPAILRFPAGTIGNWYEWRTDDFAGHPPEAPGHALRTAAFREQGRKYGFDDYIALVHEFHVEPIIMVNILTQEPEDAAAWFEDMKRKGLQVRRCEMGNEIYGRAQSNEATRTADGYIRVTKAFAAALRAKDPDLKIAVVAAPFKAGNSSGGWNETLAKEDYYDAVVCHQYPGPTKDIFRRKTIEAFMASEDIVDRLMTEYRGVFGARPMWMTEWNMALKDNEPFAHTGLHMLFVASRYLRMMDYSDTIEVACYHVLHGAAFGPAAEDKEGRAVKYAEFSVLQLMGEITQECDQMLPSDLAGRQPEAWAFPMADAKAFRGKEGVRVLLVNKLPVPKKVEISFDGQPWEGGGELETYSVKSLSDKPVLALGAPLFKTASFARECEVPPYSVSRILLRAAQ